MGLTFIIGTLAALAINLGLYRHIARQAGSGAVRIYRWLLLLLVWLMILITAMGAKVNPAIQIIGYLFALAFLGIETLAARFWGKLGFGSLVVLHLMLGGYLYTMSQVPYGDRPFAAISNNQPKPLDGENVPVEWISGLPLSTPEASGQLTPLSRVIRRPTTTTATEAGHLVWRDVEGLMNHDSHIRDVLIALREKQERDLTEMLANLNQISVNGTDMRRHALDKQNIDELLGDNAISRARYNTILETWALTDRDEKAFRSKQGEELFHAMIRLLEDHEVDESHKVELIDFMVRRYSGDVRLIRPLIALYDRLDHEYPRQKRLNQEFLKLYLQKRNAIVRGFDALSRKGLQPLLDYRRKNISEISYSQTHLDLFILNRFGIAVRPLYGVARPLSIKNFLNREKYPPLGKLAGPAYEQDYIRRNLIKTASENRLPESGKPAMGLPQAEYDAMATAFETPDDNTIDARIIDPNPAVRANLAWYLAQRKDPYTVPLIFELMRDSHPEVRRLAAVASGNFQILDMQSSNDRKFTEVVHMLVNYHSNADTFARAHALASLATVGDRQKSLYVIDLVLNDGTSASSSLGNAAPAWKDEDEKAAVRSLIETLESSPEEPYIKTQALKVLLAMDSHESLGILMHYIDHIYKTTGTRPSLLRYIVPHMTLAQEAENAEDVVAYLASDYRAHPDPLQQTLKTLRAWLSHFYQHHDSAAFFQTLRFLENFDPQEFDYYLNQTGEHILLMRFEEYIRSSYGFWLVLWPVTLAMLIFVQYSLGLFHGLSSPSGKPGSSPNRFANPAADLQNRKQAPAAAVVPIRISRNNNTPHA